MTREQSEAFLISLQMLVDRLQQESVSLWCENYGQLDLQRLATQRAVGDAKLELARGLLEAWEGALTIVDGAS